MTSMQPETGEILQRGPADTPLSRVPVTVEEIRAPVRVQDLPAKGGTMRRYALTTTGDPVQVLAADPRRRVARLIAYDKTAASDGIILGNSRGEVAAGGFSALLPIGLDGLSPVLPMGSMGEVWALALTANATLTVVPELWAE